MPRIRVTVVLVGTLLALADRAAAQCEARFQPGLGRVGVAGSVYSLAVLDDGAGPALYVGGRFTGVAGQPARNIAKWDGVRWSGLGDGVPFTVEAMVIHNGQLHAAGWCVDSQTSPRYGYVTRWDGTKWDTIVQQVSNNSIFIHDMASYNGDLYVAGSFEFLGDVQINDLARWDGQTWSDVGGASGWIDAMIVFDGELYVSEVFAPGLYGGIARWDGSTWSSVGQTPHAHYFWIEDGVLYAAGHRFDGPNGPSPVGYWDGFKWSGIGTGLGTGRRAADAVAIYHDEMFAGGFHMADFSDPLDYLARLEGDTWVPIGTGATAPVWDFAIFDDLLWIGGWFGSIDGFPTGPLVGYDGQKWHQVGSGTYGAIADLHVHDGLLFASGAFGQIENVIAGRIAIFDGTSWYDASADTGWESNAFATHDGQLYGTAYQPSRIIRWTGGGWETFALTDNSSVWSLLSWQGSLVAGGQFLEVDGVPVSRIARWDGNAWHALAEGIGAPTESARVYALTEFSANLIAAGQFSQAGSQAVGCIAAWDGETWLPLDFGVSNKDEDAAVFALAVFNGELYAAGRFETAGSAAAGNIARWNGAAWQDVGGGVDDQVDGLYVHDGQLYVLGRFQNAGGVHSPHIARWDGATWHAVDSGTDGRVATAAAYGDQLYIGGTFTFAGDQLSASFARLAPSIHLADLDSDGTVDFRDLVQLLAYYPTASGATRPEGDLDGDGDVDFDDLAAFIAAYHATCE